MKDYLLMSCRFCRLSPSDHHYLVYFSFHYIALVLLGNEHGVSLGDFRYQAMVVLLVLPLLDRKIFVLSLTRCEKTSRKKVIGWGCNITRAAIMLYMRRCNYIVCNRWLLEHNSESMGYGILGINHRERYIDKIRKVLCHNFIYLSVIFILKLNT